LEENKFGDCPSISNKVTVIGQFFLILPPPVICRCHHHHCTTVCCRPLPSPLSSASALSCLCRRCLTLTATTICRRPPPPFTAAATPDPGKTDPVNLQAHACAWLGLLQQLKQQVHHLKQRRRSGRGGRGGRCGTGPKGKEEEDKEDKGGVPGRGQGQKAMQQPASVSMRGGGTTRGNARQRCCNNK
jgi:hypothetical protein